MSYASQSKRRTWVQPPPTNFAKGAVQPMLQDQAAVETGWQRQKTTLLNFITSLILKISTAWQDQCISTIISCRTPSEQSKFGSGQIGQSNLPKLQPLETVHSLHCSCTSVTDGLSISGLRCLWSNHSKCWYPASLGQDAELKANEPCKTIKEADPGSSFTDHTCSPC